jgi:hypothetical protein
MSAPDRSVAPPSGMPPPAAATGPAGDELDLQALAGAVCGRYYEEFTDEAARYGDAGRLWCVHDNQHVLNWAALDVAGAVILDEQVAWLARVLDARGFPLDRLARNLELGAEVVRAQVEGGEPMARRLEGAAATVRADHGFDG